MTQVCDLHPGDLLVFPDGRRRCVVEVVTLKGSGPEYACAWYADMADMSGPLWKLFEYPALAPKKITVFPNVFQPEEYARFLK